MNLPTLIDVGLGLALVFFILASIGSLLAELWAAHQKLRHRLLKQTVTRLLEPDAARKFWTHSLIQPLFGGDSRRIPTPATADAPAPAPVKAVADKADKAPPPRVQPSRPGKVAHWIGTPYRWLKQLFSAALPRTAEAPAYLDAQLFASAVLDIASGQGAAGRVPNTLGAWEQSIRRFIAAKPGQNNDLQDRLLALLRQIPTEHTDPAGALKAAVAHWFEEAMQRASGAYRRMTQGALLVIGWVLALGLNVDALRIAQILYLDPDVRTKVAEVAVQEYTERVDTDGKLKPADPAQTTRQQLQGYSGELRDMVKVGFPLGWMPTWRDNFIRVPEPKPTTTVAVAKPPAPQPDAPKLNPRAAAPEAEKTAAPVATPPGRLERCGAWLAQKWLVFISPGWAAWLAKFVGLAASALAVCLGAPFWFDVIGRLVKLRSSAGADAEKKTAPAATGGAAGNPPPGTSPVGSSSGGGGTPPSPSSGALIPLPSALDVLSRPDTAFDVARTWWLAEFADRAYDTDPADLKRWLGENGFKLSASFDAQGTQGFLATSATCAVLAFRGTEKKLQDWVTDAKFELVAGDAVGVPGQIHKGFCEGLAAVMADIDRQLDALADARVLVHVTGHSLGAALATLAAARSAGRAKTAQLIQTVHTYGSPRTGDATFVEAFTRRFGKCTYRVVNNEDLVTRVPPREMSYDHVGEMIFIDEAGRLQRDIGYWYRFLNFVTNALGDLQEAVKTTIKDHSMQFYCGFLKKAAQSARPNS